MFSIFILSIFLYGKKKPLINIPLSLYQHGILIYKDVANNIINIKIIDHNNNPHTKYIAKQTVIAIINQYIFLICIVCISTFDPLKRQYITNIVHITIAIVQSINLLFIFTKYYFIISCNLIVFSYRLALF